MNSKSSELIKNKVLNTEKTSFEIIFQQSLQSDVEKPFKTVSKYEILQMLSLQCSDDKLELKHSK